MRGIDEDDLVVLVHTVLVDPVRVEHAQVPASTAHALFSSSTQRALEFEVVDTLTNGLAVSSTYDSFKVRPPPSLVHPHQPILKKSSE